jgi:hypothetical protein
MLFFQKKTELFTISDFLIKEFLPVEIQPIIENFYQIIIVSMF